MTPYPSVDDWLDSLDNDELREVIRGQSREAFDLQQRVRELEDEEHLVAERAYVQGYIVGRARGRPSG